MSKVERLCVVAALRCAVARARAMTFLIFNGGLEAEAEAEAEVEVEAVRATEERES